MRSATHAKEKEKDFNANPKTAKEKQKAISTLGFRNAKAAEILIERRKAKSAKVALKSAHENDAF